MNEEKDLVKVPPNTGLILEGGGLRGIYSAGVIRSLMEHKLEFPYTIGVSSGACNGSNYVSRQIDRNRIVNIDFITDPRYISYRRWLTGGDLFGMDFLFDTLPNKLAPFDYETFLRSKHVLVAGVSDCISGETHYFNQQQAGKDFLTILRASCSLPFLAPPVKLNGQYLMDGGITDAIPIHKSIQDGNVKHVILLTRPKGYQKKKTRFLSLAKWRYPKFKKLVEVMTERHISYNKTLEFIDRLEADGRAFVIRPPTDLAISRTERDPEKLNKGYQRGYRDMQDLMDQLQRFFQ